MSFVGRILFTHFMRNISALLFFRLMHFFLCISLSESHIIFQFNSVSELVSWLWVIISATQLRLAHSVSYVIAVIIFTKDLRGLSIVWPFHLGTANKLLATVSGMLRLKGLIIPSLARLSAWSFHLFLLWPLTLCRIRFRPFALQQLLIWLTILLFFILNQLRILLFVLCFSIVFIAALLSVNIWVSASYSAISKANQMASSSAHVEKS